MSLFEAFFVLVQAALVAASVVFLTVLALAIILA